MPGFGMPPGPTTSWEEGQRKSLVALDTLSDPLEMSLRTDTLEQFVKV